MVTATIDAHLRWVAPSALWSRPRPPSAAAKESIGPRPEILRFATDSFMDELLETLTRYPARLQEWIAQPETWRQPMPTPRHMQVPKMRSRVAYLLEDTYRASHQLPVGKETSAVVSRSPATLVPLKKESPLKLYQSAHQRYYLVSASLVFDEFSFPDRALDPVRNERATFVVRRRVPPENFDFEADPNPDTSDWDEYAFVETGEGFAWQRIDAGDDPSAKRLVAGEDQLPMFPVTFNDRCRRPRQLHAGLVPIGKREQWMGAPHGTEMRDGGQVELEGRMSPCAALLLSDVAEPWKELLSRAQLTKEELKLSSSDFPNFDASGDPAKDEELILKIAREQIQTVSWYILLDLAKFLEMYLPDVWDVISETASYADLDQVQKQTLVDTLNDTTLPRDLFCAMENVTCLDTDGLSDISFFILTKTPDQILAETPEHQRRTMTRAQARVVAIESTQTSKESAQTFLNDIIPVITGRKEGFASSFMSGKESDWYRRFMVPGQSFEETLATIRVREKKDEYSLFAQTDSGVSIYFTNMRRSLRDALVAITAKEEDLEKVDVPYVRGDESFPRYTASPAWPGFLFPLCDPDPELNPAFSTELDPFVPSAPLPTEKSQKTKDGESPDSISERIDALINLVVDALPEQPLAPEPETLMATTPVLDAREGWFVIRCVYERPHCGPLFRALVSEPTRAFQLAPFFDPDAPMRPIRIPMPMDISPAGLRKYKKNAGFVMSDMLCGMVGRIKKMTFADLVLSVLPWPFHKDLPNPAGPGPCGKTGNNNFGIICSLSIPIVTLCALVLMIIMVSLFDLFFRWIPYLFVCLPIPGLKGKKEK